MNLAFEVTELHRRLANMVLLAKVIEADYSGSIPKAKVVVGEITSAWLPMLVSRAGNDRSWWPLEIGEQVVVLSPSGELTQGVVLGSINQQSIPANGNSADHHRITYSDGAVIEYDRKAHHLKAVLPNGASTQLISEGGVEIVGDVFVAGNITATQDIKDHTRSMQADRDIYNAHTHSGIKSGPGSTAPPNQSQ